MRWEVLRRFIAEIERESIDFSTCLVLGGSSQDVEVQFLTSLGVPTKISYLGIELSLENFHYMDLNEESMLKIKGKLVLCCQVLEHVWNHENFFRNLSELTEVNGYLWLNVPMSNFVHGSPEYYSAGFTSSYLEKNLQKHKFKIVSSGSIGSKRNYLATHLLGTWLSEQEHKNPLTHYHFQPGSNLGILRKFFFDYLRRLPLILFSKESTDHPRFATESFVLAKRIL